MVEKKKMNAHLALFSEKRYRFAARATAIIGFSLNVFILLNSSSILMNVWGICLALGSACAWYAAEISLAHWGKMMIAFLSFILLLLGELFPLMLGNNGLVTGTPCLGVSVCFQLALLQPLLHILLLLSAAYAAAAIAYILSEQTITKRYRILIPLFIVVTGLLLFAVGSWLMHWDSQLEHYHALQFTQTRETHN